MFQIPWKTFRIGALFLLMGPAIAAAAGGKAEPIVFVADSRKFSGIMAWFANLYNESHLWFAMLTVLIIPVIGVILGLLADRVMSHIGIDLTSRDVAEH